MTEWGLLARIAGGGFGSTMLVLTILCLVVWVIGLLMQRRGKRLGESEDEAKE